MFGKAMIYLSENVKKETLVLILEHVKFSSMKSSCYSADETNHTL